MVSNLRTLRDGAWISPESGDLWQSLNGRAVVANVVAFSEAWQGPNHGDRQGTFWVNRKTGEKKYQADDPGGAAGTPAQQPAGSASPEADVALKAYGTKYAAEARAKFGDQAGAKLTALVAKLEADATPDGAKKLAAAKETLAALGKTKAAKDETKPTASETVQPKSETAAAKPTPTPAPAPQSGLHPHATIPDRHIRYENGKPARIHDLRPGETSVEESYFVTDERPGLVRDKDGEPLSLQLNTSLADKGDQTNNMGMRFRLRGDYAKTTIAVKNEYDGYLYDLGEQASAMVENNGWGEDEDGDEGEAFTSEQGKEAAAELRAHIDQAKGEIEEWYASALKSKFDERFDDYAGTLKTDVGDAFSDADEYLDAMEAATDADEFQEAADGFNDAINTALDHIDTEADKIDKQVEEEIDAETEAQEAERDRVVDELNDMQGTSFEKAKKLAGAHNRMAARQELPYRVSYNKDADEWHYEEFSEGSAEKFSEQTILDGPKPRRRKPKRRRKAEALDFLQGRGTVMFDESFERKHPRDHGEFATKPGAQGITAKPAAIGSDKPKRAAPGSQLAEPQKAKLRELGMTGTFPPADVPLSSIKFADLSRGPDDLKFVPLMSWSQSTGSGRISRQYRYTQAFHDRNAAEKFDRVMEVEPTLPAAKKKLAETMASGSQREKEGAAIASIIMETGLRPTDSDESVKHGHYGVGSILAKHVKIDGGVAKLDFIGKEGVRNQAVISDPNSVKYLADAIAGKDADSPVFSSATSQDALDQLKEATGLKDAKLKDLRTIRATQEARKVVDEFEGPPPPLTDDPKKNGKAIAKAILAMSGKVAVILNNTAKMAYSNYVHPQVWKDWQARLEKNASVG